MILTPRTAQRNVVCHCYWHPGLTRLTPWLSQKKVVMCTGIPRLFVKHIETWSNLPKLHGIPPWKVLERSTGLSAQDGLSGAVVLCGWLDVYCLESCKNAGNREKLSRERVIDWRKCLPVVCIPAKVYVCRRITQRDSNFAVPFVTALTQDSLGVSTQQNVRRRYSILFHGILSLGFRGFRGGHDTHHPWWDYMVIPDEDFGGGSGFHSVSLGCIFVRLE